MITIEFVCVPSSYKIGLESVYTDFVIWRYRWEQFIAHVRSDWTESVLYVSTRQLLHRGVTHASYFGRALCF